MPKSKVRKPKRRAVPARRGLAAPPSSRISRGREPTDEEAELLAAGFTWGEIERGVSDVDGLPLIEGPHAVPATPDAAAPAAAPRRAAGGRRAAVRDAMQELAYQAERAKVLAEATTEAVARARASGVHWAQIGEAFGLTAEGARKRWGR